MKASKRSRNGHKPKEKTTSVSLMEYLAKLSPQKLETFNSAMHCRLMEYDSLYGKEPELIEFQNMLRLSIEDMKNLYAANKTDPNGHYAVVRL